MTTITMHNTTNSPQKTPRQNTPFSQKPQQNTTNPPAKKNLNLNPQNHHLKVDRAVP
jgi:hypothetical protein